MGDYTPTTVEVLRGASGEMVLHYGMNGVEAEAAVRRWLAIEAHEAKAAALREAADAWGDGREGFPYHWLHERADKIEEAGA